MSISVSKWGCFNDCKFKFKCKYHDRLPDPPGPAAARGVELHLKGEYFLKGEITKLPKEWLAFEKHMKALKKMKARSEEDLSITKKLKGTTAKSRQAWFRAFADAVAYPEESVCMVIDFKTGKIYDKHKEQAEAYGMLKLLREPEIEVVEAEFWYLDQDDERIWEVDQDMVPELLQKWQERDAIMASTTVFPPEENYGCRWCAFARSKGGPCKKG